MSKHPSLRNILLIWFGWAVVLLAYQNLVQMRVSLERPDHALTWTSTETGKSSNAYRAFLVDPFLNAQVAWDSEYYLAIAVDGYDSPRISGIPGEFQTGQSFTRLCQSNSFNCYSLSYAFFPVYPILTRLVALPIHLFNLTDIAAATLAAVIISLLGTLGAMFSIYFISRKSLGEEGGVRAAFYMLIFPSGFFLAQVYSEGLFIGITFAALAFLTARKWGWAAVFGAMAVWTRPGGAILVLPFLIIWLMDKTWKQGVKSTALKILAALSPAISYLIWLLTPLAKRFFFVENQFFGRGLLALDQTRQVWSHAWQTMLHGNSQAKFFYGLEFAAILLAIITCFLLLRKRPELALFGLAMVFFAFTTGSAQGMLRYVMVAPPLFIVLSHWGKHQVFDRIWTTASVLLMGLEAMLFTFNFWVA